MEEFRMCTEIKAQDLLDAATAELDNLYSGEVFLVKDLFKGYVWNRVPRSIRLMLGTLFLNYAQQHPEQIQVIAKTSSGQQKYTRL